MDFVKGFLIGFTKPYFNDEPCVFIIAVEKNAWDSSGESSGSCERRVLVKASAFGKTAPPPAATPERCLPDDGWLPFPLLVLA